MVLDFKNTTKFAPLGEQVAEIVRITVPDFKKFQVIDRGIMGVAMRKLGLSAATVVDAGTALPVAKALRADYMIVGSIGNLGNSFSMNIKLIDTENGEVVKAVGVEFEKTLALRKVVRDLLVRIFSDGKFSGRPILSEVEYEKKRKSTGVALTYSLASLIVQSAALGGTLLLDDSANPHHIWTSAALLIPSVTPIYTEDWDYAPLIMGGSVMAGVFNFVGFALIENVPKNEKNYQEGDSFKNGLGSFMIVFAGLVKLVSVGLDLARANEAVEEYNKKLAKKHYVTFRTGLGFNHNGHTEMKLAALTYF